MANSLKFGNGNWATKDGSVLAYNDENGNFKPLPFDFTRASKATVINKNGLIEEVGSGEPRIDFKGNTKGAMLLEPSRSNLITDYTAASFSVFNGASITANDSTSPNGSTNATLMTTIGSSNQLIQDSVGISSAQSYTISGYFRLKSGTLSNSNNAFKGLDGFSGGIIGSTFNSSITSEWQRLSFTTTSSTTSGRIQIKCEDAAEILIWGFQVEQGSYSTSIIKTEGSTVTRLADNAYKQGVTQVIGQSEGTLYWEGSALANDNTFRLLSISDGTSNNEVKIQFSTTDNRIGAGISVGGAPQCDIFKDSIDILSINKVAFSYSLNKFELWVNGVKEAEDLSGSVFSLNTLNKLSFSRGNGTLNFISNTKDLRVYNTALSNSELATLTK